MFNAYALLITLALALPGAVLAETSTTTPGAAFELKTEDLNGVVGQPFVLDATRSQDDGVVGTFTWKQISGPFKFNIPSGSQVTLTPTVPGVYVFDLTVTDSAGLATKVGQTKVEISARPAPSPEAAANNVPPGRVKEPKSKIAIGQVGVNKVTVRGWDPKKKEEFMQQVKAWAELNSGKDLENFAKGILLKDDNVESTNVTDEGVQVSYNMPAKFIGLFKTSLKANAEVNSVNQVKVKFPWFGFLYTKPSASAVEQGISNNLPPIPPETVTNLQARLRHAAQTLETMSNVLKAMHESAKSTIQNIRA